MRSGSYAQRLSARLRQRSVRHEIAVDGVTNESVVEDDPWGRYQRKLEEMAAFHGPVGSVDLREVDRRLQDGGQSVSDLQAVTYEAIVLSARTPVFRVRDDVPDFTADALADLPPEVRRALSETTPSAFTPSLRATARLDVEGAHAGTGFLVGDGWMLTNRHVASLFTHGLGDAARLASYLTVTADFGREHGDAEPGAGPGPRARITGVAWVHPHWDAALLRVEGDALAGRDPVALRDHDDDACPIAVVGYPAFKRISPEYDALQKLIFGGVFGVKRFAPGRARGVASVDVPGPDYGTMERRRSLHHDASTLGGNSGSLVLAIADRGMIGLHFAGWSEESNYAVPVADLVRDTIVRGSQLHFTGVLPEAAPRESPQPIPFTPEPPSAASGPGPMATRLGPHAYADGNVMALTSVWADAEQRPALLREIAAAYGPLAAESFARKQALSLVDSDLEGARHQGGVIVFAHGIMGSNLRTEWGDRVWLDPLEIVFGDVASRLTLPTGPRLVPAGPLPIAYLGALLAWEVAGFEVVRFAYDWRRSIADIAPDLHQTLAATRAERPGVPLTLACHSMGGVVAAYWAATHPDWQSYVDHVVLAGVPLAGSYAPMEAVTGTYDLLRTVAAASARSSPEDLRVMAASFPGLVDLAPHPDVFRDAIVLGAPEGWGRIRPDRAALARSARVQAQVASSPLVGVAHVILGDRRATTASLVVEDGAPRAGVMASGDGTVPARSASRGAHPDRLYVANGKSHAFLFQDADVVGAVAAITVGEPVRLTRWTGERSLSSARAVESTRSVNERGAALAAAVRVGAQDAPTLLAALLGADDEGDARPIEVEAALEIDADPSTEPHPTWLARYPIGTDTNALSEPFRSQVEAFLTALRAATGPGGPPAVTVLAARCPPERVRLLQAAWDEAYGDGSGVSAQRRDAARAMCEAAGLDARPSSRTRFTDGLAVRLEITWTGTVEAVDADGAPRLLDADDGGWDNPSLVAMGRTYGVLHRRGDRHHWSFDGR